MSMLSLSVDFLFLQFFTISLKNTTVLGQDTEAPSVIAIDNYELDDVCEYTYLFSTVTHNLSLDGEIDKMTGKLASTLSSGSSVDKTQAVDEDKDCGQQCLCYRLIAVWQRYMEYMPSTRGGSTHST